MDMPEKLSTYDPAEDLTDDESVAVFMAEAFETGDAAYHCACPGCRRPRAGDGRLIAACNAVVAR